MTEGGEKTCSGVFPHCDPQTGVEKRMAETKAASEILHLDIRITLDMTNRYIKNTIENRIKVSEVIRKYKPNILITHPANDWHPDHIACHQIVNAAKFQAKLTRIRRILSL